jgi:hypothetical protein
VLAAVDLSEGPRFDLSVVRGQGRLRLARPLPFAFGRIDALDVDLGPLAFPLDLRRGPSTFRTRRAAARMVRARVDVRGLLAHRARLLAPTPSGGHVLVEDRWGALALHLTACGEGADLHLVPGDLRAVHAEPAPPLDRFRQVLLDLDLDLDPEWASVRFAKVLRSLLAEALLPLGWRIPDTRALSLAPPKREGPWLLLASTRRPPRRDPALERSRRLAPCLFEQAELPAVVDEVTRSELVALELLEPSPDERRPAARAAALRRPDAPVAAFERYAAEEPVAPLAAAALVEGWRRGGDVSLLARAQRRLPEDLELAEAWIGALADEASETLADELTRLLDGAARADRGRWTRRLGLAAAPRPEAAPLLLQVLRGGPDLEVLEALAAVHRGQGADEAERACLEELAEEAERRGDRPRAVEAFERLAALTEAGPRAIAYAERVARERPEDAAAAARWARRLRHHGDIEAAERIEDRVLTLLPRLDPGPGRAPADPEPLERVRQVLREAAAATDDPARRDVLSTAAGVASAPEGPVPAEEADLAARIDGLDASPAARGALLRRLREEDRWPEDAERAWRLLRWCEDPEQTADVASRLAAHFERAGRRGDAALAQVHVGVARRDAVQLRRALGEAEAADDPEVVGRALELILEGLGPGPGRARLAARLDALVRRGDYVRRSAG